MIDGSDTNTVYFSDKIRTDIIFKDSFDRIQTILDKHRIKYKFLSKTKDIWCRDFMPIQINENKFVQFLYEPSYLKKDRHLQSNPKDVLKSNKIKAEFSDINLDGGNVINNADKVILTKRVFKENSDLSPSDITKSLKDLFQSETYFVNDIDTDMTGHIDGHLRFIDSNTILVNELKNENPEWCNSFYALIEKANLEYVEIPWFEPKISKTSHSAIGIYVNYLEIGNVILFPIFETEENKDENSLEVIRSVFPERIIEPVNINEIAEEGGLLNCITWTVKE